MSGTFFALNQKYNNLRTQSTNETGGAGGGGGGGSYINYPTAQGAVTLKDTTIDGDLTYKSTSTTNRAILLDTTGLTPEYVSVGLTNNSLNNNYGASVIVGSGLCLGASPVFDRSVLIGNGIMNDADGLDPPYVITNSDRVASTVVVGSLAYRSARIYPTTAVTKENTIIGSESMNGFSNGKGNTSLGFNSGNGVDSSYFITNGDKNTFLGSESGVLISLDPCDHSTAVGSGAIITDNYQVQLGTINDYVNIPNYIKYPDGSTQNSANNFPTINKLFTTSPQSIPLSELQSYYSVAFNTGAIGTLNLPTTGLTDKSVITIFNNNYTQTANANLNVVVATNFTGRVFTGRFGSYRTTLAVRVGNWVKITWNTTTSSWDVIDKSFVNSFESTINANTDYTQVSLVNTLFRFISSNGTYNIYIPDLTLAPNNANGYMCIDNTTDFAQTLSLVSSGGFTPSATFTFGGLYGSGSNTVSIPPKSQFTIFIGLLGAGLFSVQQRFPPTISYVVPYSGTNITAYANSQYFDTNISLTGSVATTFFLPDPRSSVNAYSKGRSIVLANDGSGLITVNSTNGNIGGTHGNGGTTIILPDSTQYTFYCNGTTWEINERSADITYQNLNVVVGSVNYATNYNYLSATLNISTTTGGTIAFYPSPSATFSHLTTSIVRNVGVYDFNLQLASGNFAGLYGNTSNLLPILAGTWVKLFSDGANYLVVERSVENQRRLLSGAGATRDISTFGSYLNCDVFLTPDINNRIFIIVNPTLYPNQGYKIYNSSTVNSLSLQTPSGSFAGDARYSGYIGNTLADIPANSWLSLYSDGTNWRVFDKSTTNQIFNIAFNTNKVIDRNFYLNSVLDLTLTGAVANYTIYSPNANYVDGCYLQIFNKGALQINLVTPAGVFAGAYGSNTTTLVLPVGCWVRVVSDGTNWICDETNPNRIFDNITVGSTPTNYTSAYNYLNAYVPLNPTINNPTVQLVIPSSIYTQNKSYYIENVSSSFSLTLSIASGVFSGSFGSEATTLIVPSNSWIKMISNGTNWICNEVSNYGWTSPIISVFSNTQQMSNQWFRGYINVSGGGGNITYTIPTNKPTYYQEGLQIWLRKIMGNTGGSPLIQIKANATNTGLNPLYIGNQGYGSYPSNGNFIVRGDVNNFVMRVLRVSDGGSGTCVVNLAIPSMIYLNPTTGNFSIGSILTIGGSNYTIRGMAGVNGGLISGVAGANTITSQTPNFSSFFTIGTIFTVGGLNYTVTAIDFTVSNFGSATYPSYGAGAITFTPVIPAGGWSSAPVAGAVFAPYSGGLYGAGVYYLDANAPTGATTYTSVPNFSWAVISQ